MTVGFRFCAKDAPFRLTVMCIGGGGWLVLRASPKGLVLLELGLEVMDSTALTLCMDNDLPIIVFDMNVQGNIRRVAYGEPIGTTVSRSAARLHGEEVGHAG